MSRARRYTIRSVPPTVDAALRRRAKEEGKSLNQVVLDALGEAVAPEIQHRVFTDLDHCIGTWKEDPECEAALADQDVVDPSLWR
ncbi:MAG: hypothetical protein JXQ73_23775 [Phycisphaerae bacterium]|nr:hypothetical protein [Phycisphaerae bacterium]